MGSIELVGSLLSWLAGSSSALYGVELVGPHLYSKVFRLSSSPDDWIVNPHFWNVLSSRVRTLVCDECQFSSLYFVSYIVHWNSIASVGVYLELKSPANIANFVVFVRFQLCRCISTLHPVGFPMICGARPKGIHFSWYRTPYAYHYFLRTVVDLRSHFPPLRMRLRSKFYCRFTAVATGDVTDHSSVDSSSRSGCPFH
jgi:hypothetical protein